MGDLRGHMQVKHWMDPRLIPYGWGLFQEEEEVIVIEREEHLHPNTTPAPEFHELPTFAEVPEVPEGSISPEAPAESVLMRPGALEGPAARYAPGVSAFTACHLQGHA